MSKLTLSITTLRRHEACDLHKRVADLNATLGREVPEDEKVPLRTWWDLDTTSVADLWWSLRCLGEPGRRIGVEAACLAARRVLPLTREQDRPACLAAIEAAEGWLRGEATAEDCRRAYTVAAAAAYAAADAAAYAAADAAADAAAYAAYAADAADAADADAEREKQRADLYRIAFGD